MPALPVPGCSPRLESLGWLLPTWKTLGTSNLSLQTGVPCSVPHKWGASCYGIAAFPPSHLHPILEGIYSPSWGKRGVSCVSRGGTAVPRAAAAGAGGAKEEGAASLRTSPSSWEDKGFQGFQLGSCVPLCGQGAQVRPLLCWAVAGLVLLTSPDT